MCFSSSLVLLLTFSRGESGIGTWTVILKDTMVNEHNGTFIDWHLKLWGEAIDGSKQGLLPMPDEHDDDDHDKIISSTTTIAGTTQAITPVPTPTSLMTNPTDHPDRPVNAKPSGTEDESTSATATTSAAPEATTSASSWLPSFFPTFGVSSKTQIWIYGAAGLILIFCAALGVYLWMARRKRLRNNPRDEWEFDLLEEDEAEGLQSGKRISGKAGKGGKRRAGELYDAFAAGSEDESEEEYVDGIEGGDEREKRLYEEDDDEEGTAKHVIGDDDDEEIDEKGQQEKLLQK
jgi:kexin